MVCWLMCAPAVAQVTVNVDVKGISGALLDNVKLFLSIEQQKDHPLLSEGRIRRLHSKAPQHIRNALQPFGYYAPKIETQLIQAGPERWRATYMVDPGPPLPIAELDVQLLGEARDDSAFRAEMADLPLRRGKPMVHSAYDDAKASLARLAADRGYFDARFVEHRVEVDLQAYEARVKLHFDSGRRYRFGAVELRQDVLDPKLLARYIPFRQGQAFELGRVIELQQALNDSDYFRTVEVWPRSGQAQDGLTPIVVELTPRKRYKWLLGLGFGTDTGARAKAGWQVPRINRRGHRFDTVLKFSEIGDSLTANYRIPGRNPRVDEWVYSAGLLNERTDTRDSRIETLGVSWVHARGQWRETLSLEYQEERFRVADDEGESILLMPSATWSRIWAKDHVYARNGTRLDLNVRGATEQVVSDTGFAQIRGGAKLSRGLGRRSRVIARGVVGSSLVPKFRELPASVRFFTGGAQSVRGYAYQSLGPENADGDVVGGRHLLVGSLEYEQRWAEKWSAALFYDQGNALDDFGDGLEKGMGFGLRWRSPVGPVRIDVATALSREGRPWRLHINIGPDL